LPGSLLGIKYGISAPAYGTLAGFIAAMLLPGSFPDKRSAFAFTCRLNFKHPGIKQIMLAMVPLMIGTGISQIYVVIDPNNWLSGLAEGSIAALNYANKLVYLPQGVIVIALSTAVFPTLADRVAVGQMEEYKRALLRSTKLLLLMALPAAVGIAVLRDPIIRLLFARGAFDENAVTMTRLRSYVFFGIDRTVC
jgi:putative peptidoglycan lipid II flippase